MHSYVHVHTHAHVNTHAHMNTHVNTHMNIHVHVNTRVHVNTHTREHTHTHERAHTHVDTHPVGKTMEAVGDGSSCHAQLSLHPGALQLFPGQDCVCIFTGTQHRTCSFREKIGAMWGTSIFYFLTFPLSE